MFGKKPTKERLRQYKKLKISGMQFVIKKLNPLLDFAPEKMPQIFTSFVSRRKVDPETQINEVTLRKNQEDMQAVVVAGLVKPQVSNDGKEGTIAIDDIFADSVLALRLYTEILIHSLNAFRGIKGLFFSLKTRRLFYTEYAKNMAELQLK